jgi:signal transduction histidine kinase
MLKTDCYRLGLSAVVHELQGHVASVSMFCAELDRLAMQMDGERICDRISRMRRAAEHMQRILGAIKIIGSEEELCLEHVDLSALAVRVAQGLCERKPAYKGVRLRIQPRMDVVADSDLLEVALENLLNNAFKFSSVVSHPCVTVSSSANAAQSYFHVSDNGVGLAPEDILRIFELFARAHPRFEGSGVGLAVVRRIVERHGGCIWAQGARRRSDLFVLSLGNFICASFQRTLR